jgi:hypothetical protein
MMMNPRIESRGFDRPVRQWQACFRRDVQQGTYVARFAYFAELFVNEIGMTPIEAIAANTSRSRVQPGSCGTPRFRWHASRRCVIAAHLC